MQIRDQTCRQGRKLGASLQVHCGKIKPFKGFTEMIVTGMHLPSYCYINSSTWGNRLGLGKSKHLWDKPQQGDAAEAPWWCENFLKKYRKMKHQFWVLWGWVRGRNPSANLRIHFSSILQRAVQTVLSQHYKMCCLGLSFKSYFHHAA